MPEESPLGSKDVLAASHQRTLLSRLGFLNHTSFYGFELFMALFGLLTTAIVIDYGLFALFNYARGIGSGDSLGFVGEFSLWIVTALVVWLPVTIVFYLRSRGEGYHNPAVNKTIINKLLVSIFLFITVLTAIGALFAAIYGVLRVLVNGDSTFVDVLVRVTIPALIMAALHVTLMFSYSRANRIPRKLFAISLSVLTIFIIVALLWISAGSIRGKADDTKIVSDLDTIQSAVANYYYDQTSLPNSLSDISSLKQGLGSRLDKYHYKSIGDSEYEVCATFAQKTVDGSINQPQSYSYYPSFDLHKSGYYCFNVSLDSYSLPYDGIKQSGAGSATY